MERADKGEAAKDEEEGEEGENGNDNDHSLTAQVGLGPLHLWSKIGHTCRRCLWWILTPPTLFPAETEGSVRAASVQRRQYDGTGGSCTDQDHGC